MRKDNTLKGNIQAKGGRNIAIKNNVKKYKAQLRNPEIIYKHRVNDRDFKNLLEVDKFLKKEMLNHEVHVLNNSHSQIAIINEILESVVISINKK